MDDIRSSTASPKTNHWFEIPTLEHLSLMAIHYRRVLFGIVVAITFLYGKAGLLKWITACFSHRFTAFKGSFSIRWGVTDLLRQPIVQT